MLITMAINAELGLLCKLPSCYSYLPDSIFERFLTIIDPLKREMLRGNIIEGKYL